mmetsp:Transcript_74677/g.207610  ORF Transcript_74677/g.207610 Transcript_74677/m.207610 type:complete len:287 (+) Transcript_74677:71-931(+)
MPELRVPLQQPFGVPPGSSLLVAEVQPSLLVIRGKCGTVWQAYVHGVFVGEFVAIPNVVHGPHTTLARAPAFLLKVHVPICGSEAWDVGFLPRPHELPKPRRETHPMGCRRGIAPTANQGVHEVHGRLLWAAFQVRTPLGAQVQALQRATTEVRPALVGCVASLEPPPIVWRHLQVVLEDDRALRRVTGQPARHRRVPRLRPLCLEAGVLLAEVHLVGPSSPRQARSDIHGRSVQWFALLLVYPNVDIDAVAEVIGVRQRLQEPPERGGAVASENDHPQRHRPGQK